MWLTALEWKMESINGENDNREMRFDFASIANENFDHELEEVVNFEDEDGLIFGETDLVHEELNNGDDQGEVTEISQVEDR